MKLTKRTAFAAIVGLFVVLAVTAWSMDTFLAEPTKKSPAAKQATTDVKRTDSKYDDLKDDAFDEAFIADMLAHLEGAVNVSEQAQAVTVHEEIRTMAGQMTQTQSLAMMQMREWQEAWGFEVTNSGGHMSHGGGGAEMAGDMVEMMATLQNLSGEAYDKEFLRQMIIHHEQAIDIAKYAETNAKRQEIKDFAADIISNQNTEIDQMKEWQKAWGYN